MVCSGSQKDIAPISSLINVMAQNLPSWQIPQANKHVHSASCRYTPTTVVVLVKTKHPDPTAIRFKYPDMLAKNDHDPGTTSDPVRFST